MSERIEGDRGSWDSGPGADHDLDYKMGNPGVVLTPMQRARLKFKVNPREVERRRAQEKGNSVSKAADRIQAQLKERRGR